MTGIIRYAAFSFTGLDRSKHLLHVALTNSLCLEWCLYVSDRLAASKWDQSVNVLIDAQLSKALSFDNVLVVYGELLTVFNKNGYQG